MRLRYSNTIAIAIIIMLASTPDAIADSRLIFHDSSDGSLSIVSVKDGIVRMEERPTDTDVSFTLFDSRTRVMKVIERNDRAYYEMTEAIIGEQAQMMQGAMQGMAEEMARQMEGMSPDERRMIEEHMAQMGVDQQSFGQMGATSRDLLPTFRKTGRKDRVTGIPCEIIEAMIEGRVTEELCVAERGALSIPAADHEAVATMMDFMARISATMGAAMGINFSSEDGMSVAGIPVRIVDMEEESVLTLQEHSTVALDASLFQVPAGYRKIDPMME